uniref:Uncharacterized protein n=1 Tax=Anguilla anguilla TaxID=7936 RepID=A0A0E9X2J0_ANGAN
MIQSIFNSNCIYLEVIRLQGLASGYINTNTSLDGHRMAYIVIVADI